MSPMPLNQSRAAQPGPSGENPLLRIPAERAEQLRQVLERLLDASHVVLTTHVNADGDGTGSQAAIAAWLEDRGVQATIINPTRFPDMYRWVLHRDGLVAELGSPEAEKALDAADLLLVLDTSEPQRIGKLAGRLPAERTIVVDHHPAGPEVVGDLAIQDPTAAAAGELVYDLLTLAGAAWTEAVVHGIYVAIVTDTGSFRFSNTIPRVHAIAADLLPRGIDPELVFRRLYGTVPRRQLELLREALAMLHVDEESATTWLFVSQEVAERVGAQAEDFDGLIEHARTLEGTEVAILFRETERGETKMSFRSNGEANVNRIARQFGGGGHVKAAGALVAGPPAEVMPRVLAAVREELRGQ